MKLVFFMVYTILWKNHFFKQYIKKIVFLFLNICHYIFSNICHENYISKYKLQSFALQIHRFQNFLAGRAKCIFKSFLVRKYVVALKKADFTVQHLPLFLNRHNQSFNVVKK